MNESPSPGWMPVARSLVIAGLVAAGMIAIAYHRRPPSIPDVNDPRTSDAVVIETTAARFTRSGPVTAWHMFQLPDGFHFKLLLAATLEPGDHVLVAYTRIDANNITVHSLSRCGRKACAPEGGAPPIPISFP